jgi:hypothetical protein
MSHSSGEPVFSAVVGGIKDNRGDVFYVVRVTHSDMRHVFSVGSNPRLYNESLFVARGISRVEARSNTSTIALRVLGGDENGSL